MDLSGRSAYIRARRVGLPGDSATVIPGFRSTVKPRRSRWLLITMSTAPPRVAFTNSRGVLTTVMFAAWMGGAAAPGARASDTRVASGAAGMPAPAMEGPGAGGATDGSSASSTICVRYWLVFLHCTLKENGSWQIREHGRRVSLLYGTAFVATEVRYTCDYIHDEHMSVTRRVPTGATV